MDRFVAQRRAFILEAVPGIEAARRLSAMTDEAVRDLARAASGLIAERWALVALGGWGAGALLPESDLDLLLLSDAPAHALQPFVEAVLYPLWDAGLCVGHQVRSSRQQKTAMRTDLATCTAALTARPLAGDTGWAASEIARWQGDARKRAPRVAAELDDRPRPGSPYLLEPDLKYGAGGRRDYDEIVWRAELLGDGGLAGLANAGLLSTDELRAVLSAADIVATARWELQRDGHGDELSLEAAADLRAASAEEVQRSLGITALVLQRLRSRMDRRAAQPDAAPLTPQEVFDLLDAGLDGLPALEAAAQSGRLDDLVPGFGELMWARRPGLGHRYTVGAHSLRAACLLRAGEPDRALAASLDTVHADGSMRMLQVATLIHDAGKAVPGPGHAERGAAHAEQVAGRFGLADQAPTVAGLVRHHLLLVETALQEDPDDEDSLLRCAGELGDPSMLAPLHLLTAADARATGPSTWTPWLAALVGTLVSRLDLAFDANIHGAGTAARGTGVRAEALMLLGDGDAVERAYVENASLRYLSCRTPAQVARDAGLIGRLAQSPPASGALLDVANGPAAGTHAITVATADRPGLLALLAGALSLAGLDILSVDTHRTTGGFALYAFVVSSATRKAVTSETFSAVERHIRSALRDRLEVAVRLAERRKHYRTAPAEQTEVDIKPLGWATRLHVTTPNRPGLLHDIARAVADSGAEIRWACAQTVDGIARDTFHIVDVNSSPVDDIGTMGHVAMNIRDAI